MSLRIQQRSALMMASSALNGDDSRAFIEWIEKAREFGVERSEFAAPGSAIDELMSSAIKANAVNCFSSLLRKPLVPLFRRSVDNLCPGPEGPVERPLCAALLNVALENNCRSAAEALVAHAQDALAPAERAEWSELLESVAQTLSDPNERMAQHVKEAKLAQVEWVEGGLSDAFVSRLFNDLPQERQEKWPKIKARLEAIELRAVIESAGGFAGASTQSQPESKEAAHAAAHVSSRRL